MYKRLSMGLVAVAAVPLLLWGVAGASRAEKCAAKPFMGVLAGPAENEAGAVIRSVDPQGPADHAGLKAGDRIVKIGDKDVKDAASLADLIAEHKPGDKLMLSVFRDGKEQKIEVTLAERRPLATRPDVRLERQAFLGVWAQPLNEDLKKELGVAADKGAVIMHVVPSSPAAKAELAEHDVITALNDLAVTGPQELRDAVAKIGAGKEATVKFQRGKEAKEAKVMLGESGFRFGGLDGKEFTLPPGFDHADMQKLLDGLHKQLRDLEREPAAE